MLKILIRDYSTVLYIRLGLRYVIMGFAHICNIQAEISAMKDATRRPHMRERHTGP